MIVTLENGLRVEGTITQINDLAKRLGYMAVSDRTHYHSSTKGLIRIKDMDTRHLINAVLKMYRAEVENLPKDRISLVAAFRTGVVHKNVTLNAMVDELLTRRD